MANARAGNKSGQMVLLDQHLATGTEATYTYTPSLALDMKATYREIHVIITGSATAALTMKALVNANTDLDLTDNLSDTTTISTAIAAAAAYITLLGSGVLDGANTFYIKIVIVFNDAADHLMIYSTGAAPHEGNETYWHEDQSTDTTITSIEILTSTSTWIAGTEITTYGIKR